MVQQHPLLLSSCSTWCVDWEDRQAGPSNSSMAAGHKLWFLRLKNNRIYTYIVIWGVPYFGYRSCPLVAIFFPLSNLAIRYLWLMCLGACKNMMFLFQAEATVIHQCTQLLTPPDDPTYVMTYISRSFPQHRQYLCAGAFVLMRGHPENINTGNLVWSSFSLSFFLNV